ncbi:MAG: hypothetical protein HFG49_07600 [Lachnospiraceae bacterium]|jgi:hypothetical protein|nr:hypothetical protein [Lachnospiraceae bacterium]
MILSMLFAQISFMRMKLDNNELAFGINMMHSFEPVCKSEHVHKSFGSTK